MHIKNLTFLSILCFASSILTAENKGENTPFIAKEFPHLSKMPGWNQDLLQMHLKLYQGYVKNSNELEETIKQLSLNGKSKSYEFGALKRRFAWEFDGMRLHELYFENLGNTSSPSQALTKALEENFGSFNSWKTDFIGTGLIRGIGWAILYQDPNTKKLYNTWINEHDTGHLLLSNPILIMDVFEHAYITQFGIDKAKYIDLFFQSINWDEVNKRFQKE